MLCLMSGTQTSYLIIEKHYKKKGQIKLSFLVYVGFIVRRANVLTLRHAFVDTAVSM